MHFKIYKPLMVKNGVKIVYIMYYISLVFLYYNQKTIKQSFEK